MIFVGSADLPAERLLFLSLALATTMPHYISVFSIHRSKKERRRICFEKK
jgi:hypothetical protein